MFGKVVDLRPEILPGGEQGAKDRKLRKACEELESVFTYQLLRSMRRTVEKCDLFHGGSGEEVYESLLDQELSKSMTGIDKRGLADLLYRQLRRKDGPDELGGKPPFSTEGVGSESPFWPLEGGRISSGFGWRTDPITGKRRYHQGLDVAAGQGTPIAASLPGRVVRSEYRGGYGNVVELDHGRGITTLYAHNQENLVSVGDWVRAGDPVARVGSTGRSTGPHLHFEVKRHGRTLDPREFLEENKEPNPA
ncbi:MAG: peptidoglycan DD-metalloendopeptidase family protein [Deltaproteobacteria bacterium]|nr:peptidoglycan DD-metalloendopeptidase family protein [Deltaproteobacteria bacterium]